MRGNFHNEARYSIPQSIDMYLGLVSMPKVRLKKEGGTVIYLETTYSPLSGCGPYDLPSYHMQRQYR